MSCAIGGRAAEIPDPVLRRLALQAHHHSLGNLEGAAAFATFVKPDRRAVTVRALVAFQAAYDYVDIVSEQTQHADAIDRAYFPWINALHTMLDSLIDYHEDTRSSSTT